MNALGSQCRIASVFTRTVDNVTIHGIAFRGAPVLIEQPFSVDELVKAAQKYSQAIRNKFQGAVDG